MRCGLRILGRKPSSVTTAAAARGMAPKAAFSSGASITVDLSKAFDLHSTFYDCLPTYSPHAPSLARHFTLSFPFTSPFSLS